MKKIYFLVLALGLFTSVNAQIVTIPDVNFKAKLLAASPTNSIAKNLSGVAFKIDSNNDSQIQITEAAQVGYLNLENLIFMPQPIYSLDGISSFINLKGLVCDKNELTSIDLSSLTLLESLDCSDNHLTQIDLTNQNSLKYLYFSSNNISSIDVSNQANLLEFKCSGNQLPLLNVSQNLNLVLLYCDSNQLTSLNLNGLTNLQDIRCSNNQLTTLDVSGFTNLNFFYCNDNLLSYINLNGLINLDDFECRNNQLTSLDLSDSANIQFVLCDYNLLTSIDLSNAHILWAFTCANNTPLESINIKNGSTSTDFDNDNVNFSNNPNLKYICSDEADLNLVQNLITSYGYTNCHVNTYCTFEPGGDFYTIQGNNKYDENNNGCDALDLGLPNLKFNITRGAVSGNLISNTSGNYSIPVQSGTHVLTPILENPAYFTVSPSTVNIVFPSQASPFTQNFCVSANGVHPDLEVALLPIISARPGFDVKYKLTYKNKGNTTQSGTVNLGFNDAVLDLVSANPVASTQTVNNLSWDFTNLLPFETREIALTLNVNSPMETPAVNGGDVLNYTATITSAATDDMPSDNTFTFPQTVVNSFDPNDKTCLEGATIAPVKVGDYVHYMIRFENNGTANAQNIVVKDMIDLAKFDINSLVPLKGSHPFVTNITSGNKVEFIFENINLPFDNANNDGYLAFKIKTKPTLVLGNTFSNTASIYFDYNFPIVTNTATTTIAALSRQDFEFSDYFNVYPNPVSDVLNIATKTTIEVSSINIYNTLGQLVLVIPNAKNIKTVNVSDLSTGNYFIKINSDKGVSNTKFIKN